MVPFTACLSWTRSTDLDAGVICEQWLVTCWLQDEYLCHINGLQALLCKGQELAAQMAQKKLSSKTAEITAEKRSLVVFQQAASLSKSKDGQAVMMQECTQVSQKVEQLQEEESSLKLQLLHDAQQYQTMFGQRVLHDLDTAVDDLLSDLCSQ